MKALKSVVSSFPEGTLTRIPLGRIVQHPDIPYRPIDESWVSELSANIANVGLDTPIVVWNGGGEKGQKMQLGKDGEKVPASFLVAGNHRLAALKTFSKENISGFKDRFPDGIPVNVIGGELQDAIIGMLRENAMRLEQDPESVFRVLKRLMKKEDKGGFGMNQSEIAKAIGKTKGWVSQILSVEEELGEEAVEDMKKGDLKFSSARRLAAESKKSKKAGKPIDVKAKLAAEKEKTAKRKAAGKERAERRLSAKTLWSRYVALPKLKIGESKDVLESALAYLAGDEDVTLHDLLQEEAEENNDEDTTEE